MPISIVERGKHIFKELLKKTIFKSEVTWKEVSFYPPSRLWNNTRIDHKFYLLSVINDFVCSSVH